MKPGADCSRDSNNSHGIEKLQLVEPLHSFEALKFVCSLEFVNENNEERASNNCGTFPMLVYPPSGEAKDDGALVLEGKTSRAPPTLKCFELTPDCNLCVHVYCMCVRTWWMTLAMCTRVIKSSELKETLPFGEKSDQKVWYIDVPMDFEQNMRSETTAIMRLHVIRERNNFYIRRGVMKVPLEEADHWFRVSANAWRQAYGGLSVITPDLQ